MGVGLGIYPVHHDHVSTKTVKEIEIVSHGSKLDIPGFSGIRRIGPVVYFKLSRCVDFGVTQLGHVSATVELQGHQQPPGVRSRTRRHHSETGGARQSTGA